MNDDPYQSPRTMLIAFFIIAGLIWLFVSIPYSIRWVVGPIDSAARSRRFPRQFNLADFLCLFFLLQLPLALLQRAFFSGPDDQSRRIAIPIGIGTWIAGGMMWWFAVHILSRAGVDRVLHRCLFLVLIMPFALVGSVVFGFVPLVVAARLSERGSGSWHGLWLLMGMEVGLFALIFAAGRFTRSMVRGVGQCEIENASGTGHGPTMPMR
jgi:hypothetical protein